MVTPLDETERLLREGNPPQAPATPSQPVSQTPAPQTPSVTPEPTSQPESTPAPGSAPVQTPAAQPTPTPTQTPIQTLESQISDLYTRFNTAATPEDKDKIARIEIKPLICKIERADEAARYSLIPTLDNLDSKLQDFYNPMGPEDVMHAVGYVAADDLFRYIRELKQAKTQKDTLQKTEATVEGMGKRVLRSLGLANKKPAPASIPAPGIEYPVKDFHRMGQLLCSDRYFLLDGPEMGGVGKQIYETIAIPNSDGKFHYGEKYFDLIDVKTNKPLETNIVSPDVADRIAKQRWGLK